jgi:Replication initiator protein A
MVLAAKQNYYEKLIKELFKKYRIPFHRPEYKEFIEQGKKFSFGSIGKLTPIESGFEDQIKALSEKVEEEAIEAFNKEKEQERSLQIASERSLAPVKLNNSRILMALPWFSPDQRLRKECFEYSSADGSVRLRVHPSPMYGAAKVWDGDVLMYALSKATKAYLETKEFPPFVTFSAYEYLKQAGKAPQSNNRKVLRESLQRLSHTSYECTFIDPKTTKKKGEDNFFLCSAKWLLDENDDPAEIEIRFSDELFKHFATKNDLLTLKQGLLLEAWKEDRSGLRKRLLMLVATHLGEQRLWKVGLKTLQGMCGHNSTTKRFKEAFTAIIPSLPWLIEIEKNQKGEQIVIFISKSE